MRFGHEYEVSRREKAEKIIRILKDFSGKDLGQFDCLDIGCANGIITHLIKEEFHSIFGVEIDEKLAREAVINNSHDLVFIVADGGKTPFISQSFNVIVCTQVYEHTPDPKSLSGEIWRLLKSGGICFFSGPNRLSPLEEHYGLPFLSWLPRQAANLYLRIAKRGNVYDVHPLFYWQLRDLFARFEIHDYTVQLISQPERYAIVSNNRVLKFIKNLPIWIIKLFILFLPNYNWVLVKRV